MIFAPTLRHARLVSAPRASDAALQRFLLSAAQASPARAPVQVQDDERATTLQLDVPGLAREQIDISIEEATVRLQSVEGAPRQLQRAWELPHEIDAANSSAKLENGVLTLVLGKLAPQSKAVTLAVQ